MTAIIAAPTTPEYSADFVLVGALAAHPHGFPRLTADAELTPEASPENVDRLAAALRELNARVYTDSVPEGLALNCSAAMLSRSLLWNLVTDAGRVHLVYRPASSTRFEELRKTAVEFDINGTVLFAASLRDILRLTQASDRPQARQDALVIREMLGET